MLRRAFLIASFLALAFVAGAPAQALAHGGQAHPAGTVVAAADEAESPLLGQGETESGSESLQSYSQPDHQPPAGNDCHCPACHGCCHAPALSEASDNDAPVVLRVHVSGPEDGWSPRRWRSAIENPPKTLA